MVSHNEWWTNSHNGFNDQIMTQASEELPSGMIPKDFVANITEEDLNALKNELRHLDLTFQKRASNIITVSGRDEAVLNGRELLAALRRYDRNARHDD